MIASNKEKLAAYVKELASDHGFDFCGIAKAEKLSEEEDRLSKWLKQGMHGEMIYMENYFEERLDPRRLVPGAKSVVSFIYNYFPSQEISDTSGYKIAKYAYGKDYHYVIKKKLREFLSDLKSKTGDFNGRIFVDSAPVLERPWAARSGLGWIGKNSLLLNQKMGSFFFLAFLISDLELQADSPVPDHCGTCNRCIEACPTDAIPNPYVVDASKCISYFTIELKNEIPSGFEDKFDDWIFGCDICQDVCPWNKFSKPHAENEFEIDPHLSGMNKRDWEELTEETFKTIFKDSPVKRTGYKGLRRNISYISRKK